MNTVCLSYLLMFTVAATVYPQERGRLLPRQPTLSQTQVVFSYAGDLWIVDRRGGEAKRLTSGPADDSDAVFSPDGTLVLFSRDSERGRDVYVVPAAGGEVRRLTYHPGDEWYDAVGWTRDGKPMFYATSGYTDGLFSVSAEGGPAVKLPVPSAYCGSFSPDGKRLALSGYSRHREWRRYRGGGMSRISIADLPDCRIEKIPRNNSNDFNPMWVDDRIYFLSDRDGLISLFAYDTTTKKVRKVIDNPESDILSASAGPGAIVYERFGSLHLYDLRTGKSSRLELRVSGEMPEMKPRSVKAIDNLTGIRLSPAADRVLIEARGELLVMPVGKGEMQNVTNTPGVRERFPAWSPNGRRIAYFSDESGEYALHIRDVDGTGSVMKIDLGTPPGFYFSPTWSPDSKKIAYRDHRLALWYVDVAKGTPIRIDSDTYPERLWARIEAPPPSWSPDSRWLSYTKMLRNHMRALCIYSLETSQSHRVTDGMIDVYSPQFDRSGKYVYFAASTDIGPTLGGELSTWYRTLTRSIYIVFLQKDGRSPTSPAPNVSATVDVDFEHLEDRITALPVPARDYTKLVSGKPGVLYLLEAATQPKFRIPGMSASSNPLDLHQFELATKKTNKVIEGIRDFDLSFDGEKMLYRQGQKWVVSPTGVALKPDKGALKLESVQVHVDPAAEWRQMLREVYRMVRDFFYDPGYHGLDLKAQERELQLYLESVTSPADLNCLFQEFLSDLRVSHCHAYARMELPEEHEVIGLLGADYETAEGRYRFGHIYAGDKWDPTMRAPLVQPGIDIKQGDFLLAVDGRELRASDNIYGLFLGKAGKDVVLRIASDATGSDARQVTVVPIDDEWGLRYFARADEDRRRVDRLSGGSVAYIFLPNTGVEGLAAFDRYFFAQVDKEAAIIDERGNSGGAMADYFISRLGQRVMALGTAREGLDGTVPYSIIRGPKVMITNEESYSGGDSLPYFFKQAGLGPLVGTRTAGGVMGPFGMDLIDGGWVSIPYFGVYDPDGKWLAENEGIAPDIEVEQDPAAVCAGHDPQLEKAIEVVMDLLKKNPPPEFKRPPYKRLQ